MGSFGTVPLKKIWAMLDHCANGYTKTATTHHWRICFGTETYPSLPLGDHGARANPDIQIGHVKRMARTLKIMDCAKTFLEL